MATEPNRLPRYKRVGQDRLPFRLQDRDREILTLVYDYRILTSRHIQCLTPGSDKGILSRLQKLYHAGYLDRLKLSNNDPILYGLGNRGADELALMGVLERGSIDWTAKNREVKERYLAHSLMITNFRATLTLALRDRPDTRIFSWTPESKDLRDIVTLEEERQGRHGRPYTAKLTIPIVPDAAFTLEDRGDHLNFFVECDRSTMTTERFLKKLQGYWHWWQQGKHEHKFGISSFRVLTITKSEERRQNLRTIAKEADRQKVGSRMFYFACEKSFSIEEPATILGSIWQTPRDDEFHRLLE